MELVQIDIKAEIKHLLALCGKANAFGNDTQREADESFWLSIRDLDRRAKDGQHPVNPGRFVRLQAKDSYAYYIVIKVTKKICKLQHIPYGSAYESNAVRDGEADIDVIEKALAFYDQIDSRFQEMGRKPLEDKTREYGMLNEDVEAEIMRIRRFHGLDRAGALLRMFAARA